MHSVHEESDRYILAFHTETVQYKLIPVYCI